MMMKKTNFTETNANQLINWYIQNKRDLPWRDTGNPYDIWLSEIMLQQTRIEAVRPKFIHFKEVLPSIYDLARVEEETLMRLWEGLGYYSRATNLKKCANVLVDNYNGTLPATYTELIQLPGIGPYTAGAIASIAFHEPISAIDGNVLRVMSRFEASHKDVKEASTKQIYTDKLNHLLQSSNIDSALFNQAIMELGEVICLPNGKPKCLECPLHHECLAYKNDLTDAIPVRKKLKERKIKNITILVIRDHDSFLIHKRPSSGLLANLFEFIQMDGHLKRKEVITQLEEMNISPLHISTLPDSKHIFTHLEWHMIAYEVTVGQIEDIQIENCSIVTKQQLNDFAIPSAFKTYVSWYDLRKENT